MYIIVRKCPSNDDVGDSRDTVFEEIRSGAGVKTGDLDKEKLGGATVEQLRARVNQTEPNSRQPNPTKPN